MREEVRPEPADVATGPIVWIGLGFLAFVALSVAALMLYLDFMVTGSMAVPPRAFPAPRLQGDPRADRLQLEARQAAELRGYAWVDRSAGLAHIPIEDAMALVAARGRGAFDPLNAPALAPAADSQP